MKIRAFITHKQAEGFSDCQDRFSVNADTKSIAVSDGMGSTWQQKIWAKLLVDKFARKHDWLPSHESIKPLCLKWREEVIESIQHLKDTNAPENIIYRNERNLAGGCSAGATFVGIRFKGKQWSGSVLGDSCLIEWDGNEAIFHTSQDVEAFDSYPDYFDSDATKEGKGNPKDIEGILTDGKYLLLVSDPFSDFMLEHKKQGDIAQHINELLKVSSHESFEALVSEWRTQGMHNDDTTLLIVENDNCDVFKVIEQDDINILIEKEKQVKDKVIEQSTTKHKQDPINEKTETVTSVDANVVIDEVINEIKENRTTLKQYSLMEWCNIIKKTIRNVLKRYIIIKI